MKKRKTEILFGIALVLFLVTAVIYERAVLSIEYKTILGTIGAFLFGLLALVYSIALFSCGIYWFFFHIGKWKKYKSVYEVMIGIGLVLTALTIQAIFWAVVTAEPNICRIAKICFIIWLLVTYYVWVRSRIE